MKTHAIMCGGMFIGLCQISAGNLTNPPNPNIDYALAFSPPLGGLVMHGGWCDPDWKPRAEAWLVQETGWESTVPGPAMMHHSSAFDEHRNVIVVCGRTNFPNQNINLTYEFNGTVWVQKPALIAGNNGDVELAYDSARRTIVAYVSDFSQAETWEYNATNWAQVSTTTQPTACGDGALMAFDPGAGKTVLVVPEAQYGKADGSASETWLYDGTDWAKAVSGPPTNACLGGMAYDAARSNVVVLTTDSATWTWSGTAWTQRAPVHFPQPARGFFTLAYDPVRERALFFSGEYSTGDYVTVHPIDTWEWDGADWQQFVPVPEPGWLGLLLLFTIYNLRFTIWRRR